mmetsp:Transcript_13773/g.32040  ORF Transcript_13773/g.32040 Transcript_13773/m.32040 type:complete len:157 (-) Transcript_13773:804-1274(-)
MAARASANPCKSEYVLFEFRERSKVLDRSRTHSGLGKNGRLPAMVDFLSSQRGLLGFILRLWKAKQEMRLPILPERIFCNSKLCYTFLSSNGECPERASSLCLATCTAHFTITPKMPVFVAGLGVGAYTRRHNISPKPICLGWYSNNMAHIFLQQC